MRCDKDSISGNSDDIKIIAVPSSANLLIISYISDLTPTSTPLVGSSRINTLGFESNHLEIIHFCWFPPDNSSINCLPEVKIILNLFI